MAPFSQELKPPQFPGRFNTSLALNLEGKKEILGLYLSGNEGGNSWLSVLTDLQNRGVQNILIACVDGLTGFPEAINGIYQPQSTNLIK